MHPSFVSQHVLYRHQIALQCLLDNQDKPLREDFLSLLANTQCRDRNLFDQSDDERGNGIFNDMPGGSQQFLLSH